jgi:DNA-binding LacI/PurR family transcriptional regulator
MPARRITSHDVAREAGVSQTTVSVVLSETPGPIQISAATRERVLAAAERLGYVPNHVAQSLRRRRSRTITFINPAPENPYFAEVVAGAQASAEQAGYSIFVAAVPDREQAVNILSQLNAGTSDGVILGSRDEAVMAELRHALRRGLAAVALQYMGEQSAVPVVRTDKEFGGHLATAYLIDLGHRRIGHLKDAAAYADHPGERTAGYLRALDDGGIDFDPNLIVQGKNSIAGGDAAMRELLSRGRPRPTAVFAFNDLMAIGALHALDALGVRVPDDIAVIGFDGIELGAFTNPELTSVAQPSAEVGRRAFELVFDLLHGRSTEVRDVTLPLRLVIRDSCGWKAISSGR